MTQKCLEDRELNQERSKLNTVDQPVRTARTFVHHYNSTQYCQAETVILQYSASSRPTSHLRCNGGNLCNYKASETEMSQLCISTSTVDIDETVTQLGGSLSQ